VATKPNVEKLKNQDTESGNAGFPALSGRMHSKAELRDIISTPAGRRSGLETTRSEVE
jgi:hypothetical protein